MKHLFLLAIILCYSLLSLKAQDHFPDRCAGVWEGTMEILQEGKFKESVPVVMTIERLEGEELAWTWKTEYNSEKYQVTKDYILKMEDVESNRFTLDEGDGILLYEYQFGDKLYSAFEVQGNYLTSSYELVGEHLVFEISSGKRIEGDTEGVVSYSVLNVQKVVLSRRP